MLYGVSAHVSLVPNVAHTGVVYDSLSVMSQASASEKLRIFVQAAYW